MTLTFHNAPDRQSMLTDLSCGFPSGRPEGQAREVS